jgi:kynurenine formamidase
MDVVGLFSAARLIDLTYPLHSGIPYWPGQGYHPFRWESINQLETHGVAAGRFAMPEHLGTHVDAPSHFVPSPITADRIPLEDLVRPGVVVDISRRAAWDEGALLEPGDLEAWEAEHGPIPPRAIVLLHSGWGRRWSNPAAFANPVEGRLRFPAVSAEAARLLVEARDIAGLGVDTLSADNGEVAGSPCHRIVHGAGRYIVENLANLELLPPTGMLVVIAPLPIVGGTGAPARVFAMIGGQAPSQG